MATLMQKKKLVVDNFADIIAELETIQAENGRLVTENRRLANDKQLLTSSVSEKEKTIDAFTTNEAERKAEMLLLLEDKQRLSEELLRLQERIMTLETASVSESRKRLKNQYPSDVHEDRALRVQLDAAHATKASLAVDLSAAQGTIASLMNDLETANQKAASLKAAQVNTNAPGQEATISEVATASGPTAASDIAKLSKQLVDLSASKNAEIGKLCQKIVKLENIVDMTFKSPAVADSTYRLAVAAYKSGLGFVGQAIPDYNFCLKAIQDVLEERTVACKLQGTDTVQLRVSFSETQIKNWVKIIGMMREHGAFTGDLENDELKFVYVNAQCKARSPHYVCNRVVTAIRRFSEQK